jgi:CSLREA domain-containing protein
MCTPRQSVILRLAAIATIVCSVAARAATITVTSGADSGGTCPGPSCTLRQAIAVSNSGDTINFDASVTKISLTSDQLLIEHELTIAGPGPGLLEVTRSSGPSFRIFKISNSGTSGPAVSISGLAITNGNAAGDGGGILSEYSPLTVTNCTFSGNSAPPGYGGGISNVGSTLTVSNCTFSNNSALGGGAINSTGFFSGNATLIARDSTFSNNAAFNSPGFSSYGFGGAIENNGTGTLSNCTFNGNTATASSGQTNGRGGAIQNGGDEYSLAGSSALTLRNCTITGNTASDAGGAIANVSSGNNRVVSLTVSNSTVNGNSATAGGGIYNLGEDSGNAFVKLDNTILASTNAQPGSNLFQVGGGTSITSEGYNLSTDNGGGFLTASGDQINTDPKLGPLQNNGGPTLTMALLPGSPAQDKGKNFGVTTDQRGLARPIDIPGLANAAGGDGSDIGAVEMAQLPPFIVTTTADHDDGSCTANDCTLREAIKAANASGGTDTIFFGSGVTGVITLQLALGTLTVTDSVTILGPGPRVLAVSGNEDMRVFTFSAGTSLIAGLTIRDGWLAGNSGDGASRFGGGIYNHGTLTVVNCTFSNNFVSGANNLTNGANGGDGRGAAIFNDGTLSLNYSTFGPSGTLSGNVVSGGPGATNTAQFGIGGSGGVAQGGAVFNSGTLTATTCTFEGNGAAGGGGGSDTNHFGGSGAEGSGGAIYNSGTMTLTACTISGNNGVGGTGGQGNNSINNGISGLGNGGVKTSGGSATVRNTIIAANTGNHGGAPDVNGVFSSGGYNLLGSRDHSTGFTATADQGGTDSALLNPRLDSLKDNGGATDTMALLAGSPALDRGNAFGIFSDQRGGFRTIDLSNAGEPPPGDATDIGAFEKQATSPTTLANVATRLKVETGDNVLFGGFIVTGTQPKKVIIRALGPSVNAPGVLANPTLELHGTDSNGHDILLASNDDWQNQPAADKQAVIDSTVPPPNDLESALVRTLPANNATYTAIVRGANNGTGIGVVEVYDLDSSANSKLANISTRGLVQTGDDVLIAGTIVTGQAAEQILVCALGPSLPVPGNLADPTLELRDGSGTLLEANDNWVDSPNKQAIMNSGAPPTNDLESAIIHTVSANGAIYTAIVRGVNNSTGVAVVEVFALN